MRVDIRADRKRPTILVTAGPTREKIDPVRFISNYSTGTFGYEIAREAKRRGCRVTLISGPTWLEVPRGVKVVRVESAVEMKRAVLKSVKTSDYVIMAAAVSDWRVAYPQKKKIKRGMARKRLELVENPDILKDLGNKRGRVLVGFALETEDVEKNAVKKLKEKNLDFIIANKLSPGGSVFGENKPSLLIIDRSGHKTVLRDKTKRESAKIILDKILNFNI